MQLSRRATPNPEKYPHGFGDSVCRGSVLHSLLNFALCAADLSDCTGYNTIKGRLRGGQKRRGSRCKGLRYSRERRISPRAKARDISTIYLKLIGNLLIALPAGCTTCACKKKQTRQMFQMQTHRCNYMLNSLFLQFQQVTLHLTYTTHLCLQLE